MEKIPSIDDAMRLWITEEYSYSAISTLDLFKQYALFFQKREYLNKEIFVRKNANLESMFSRFKKRLRNSIYFPLSKHVLLDKNKNIPPSDILCSIYPNTYISYLSAMRYYSITDILPKTLQLISLDRVSWNKYIEKDYREFIKGFDYREDISYLYKKHSVPYPQDKDGSLLTIDCKVYVTSKPKRSIQTDSGTRVISIGGLFIDMIENPDLCGGINHVIDIYLEYGQVCKKDIFTSLVEASVITQARVGFIFDKVLEEVDPYIAQLKNNQINERGGSRKFVSTEPYSDTFSPEWNISLNVDRLKMYGTKY